MPTELREPVVVYVQGSKRPWEKLGFETAFAGGGGTQQMKLLQVEPVEAEQQSLLEMQPKVLSGRHVEGGVHTLFEQVVPLEEVQQSESRVHPALSSVRQTGGEMQTLEITPCTQVVPDPEVQQSVSRMQPWAVSAKH